MSAVQEQDWTPLVYTSVVSAQITIDKFKLVFSQLSDRVVSFFDAVY